jgi:PEGA domain
VIAAAAAAAAVAVSVGLYLSGSGAAPTGSTKSPGRTGSLATGPAPSPAVPPVPTVAPTPATVEVELFVDPPADVEVDGQALGRVQSTRVPLTVGKHTFRQRIQGYREKTHEVEVTGAGQTVTLHLPPFGMLTVVNDFGVAVQGASVYLDGNLLGPLPARDRKVEAGTHELRVVWPDGSEYHEQTEVTAATQQTRVVRPQ